MPDYIVINEDLRTMTIPQSITLLGVESDDDVNKIYFKMPKEYCGFDLSTFEARINYLNANNEGDIYIVEDLTVDNDDPSLMDFTWLVGRNACAYKGRTQFIVCLKKFADDDSGTVLQEFNTTVYSLPVLQGLETVEAVVQQNPDIIEYILRVMRESGVIDPDDYYTKAQVNALLPTKLPNPYKLTINGNDYDGSEEVIVDIDANSTMLKQVSGKLIHVPDAVPDEYGTLVLKDSNDDPITAAAVAVANKNLFRLDLISDYVLSKGIVFDKQDDGSIVCSGTSTDSDAVTSCSLDKNLFEVGRTYTLSSGKALGFVFVQLYLVHTDNSTETIIAQNSSRTFTITKPVASCTASVMVAQTGATVDGEVVKPQLEVGQYATTFTNNYYDEVTFDGTQTSMTVQFPDEVTNIWSNTDTVTNIVMSYEADIVDGKIAEYVEKNVFGTQLNGVLVAKSDGLGTVTLGLG